MRYRTSGEMSTVSVSTGMIGVSAPTAVSNSRRTWGETLAAADNRRMRAGDAARPLRMAWVYGSPGLMSRGAIQQAIPAASSSSTRRWAIAASADAWEMNTPAATRRHYGGAVAYVTAAALL